MGESGVSVDWASVTKRMFVRQFSIRLLLVITTFCAVISLIVNLSLRGQIWWASAIVASLASLSIVLLVHVGFYCLVRLAAVVLAKRSGLRGEDRPVVGDATNPFAEGERA